MSPLAWSAASYILPITAAWFRGTEPNMLITGPPDAKKPFLVRSSLPADRPPREVRDPLFDFANNALIPLAFVFLGVLFATAYLCMNGRWEGAKDLLCIFLPSVTALMGAASAAYFRS